MITEDLGVGKAVVRYYDVVGRIPQTGGIIRTVKEKLGPVVGDNDVWSSAIEIRKGVAFSLFKELKP